MEHLILFDIDGTLILTGGAGLRALDNVFLRLLGAEAAEGIPEDYQPAGKSDRRILSDIYEHFYHRIPTPLERDDLEGRYLIELKRELDKGRDTYVVLPGVLDLLEALRTLPSTHVALGTGNLEQAAQIKLAPGNLNYWFEFGGFGSDSTNRAEILLKAIERFRESKNVYDDIQVTVVGDTPLDIQAAREISARCLAVATGSYTRRELETADLVVDTLDDAKCREFLGF